MSLAISPYNRSLCLGLCTLALLVAPVHAIDLRDWGNQLPAKTRFVVLNDFGTQAVLDKETQLVWETKPSSEERVWAAPFVGAVDGCYVKNVGGRKGWRLPTMEELSTLVDPAETMPALPPDHPFLDVLNSQVSSFYWTATTDVSLPTRAYRVNFATGGVSVADKSASVNKSRFWCVRGGQGNDGL